MKQTKNYYQENLTKSKATNMHFTEEQISGYMSN